MNFYQQSTIFGNPCLDLSIHRTRFTIEQDKEENGVGVTTPFVSRIQCEEAKRIATGHSLDSSIETLRPKKKLSERTHGIVYVSWYVECRSIEETSTFTKHNGIWYVDHRFDRGNQCVHFSLAIECFFEHNGNRTI